MIIGITAASRVSDEEIVVPDYAPLHFSIYGLIPTPITITPFHYVEEGAVVRVNCTALGDVYQHIYYLGEGGSVFLNEDIYPFEKYGQINFIDVWPSQYPDMELEVHGHDQNDITKAVQYFDWGDCKIVQSSVAAYSLPNQLPESLQGISNLGLIGNTTLQGWDVSFIRDLSYAFRGGLTNPDIAGWDVSSCVEMYGMFRDNKYINRDLSGWCVNNIPEEPFEFADGAYNWTLPKPVWGTCPQA